ncbi:YDG domain-containing protein [Pseudorhodoferax sp. LjRoot39]|uniref:YDG domain-containing protein n=1 Tax=Pseudorhodoferax sp. LjRoot39 TaxID=3342328 RepID=UPI003ECCB456
MNHIYKLVWNAVHQAWVAVSEVASTVAGTSLAGGAAITRAGAAFSLTMLAGSIAMAQTPAPGALPQGGVVTQGQAQIIGGNSVLNVNQSSQRATIQWDSFNLGAGATVNFNQPNAQAGTLNRVQDMNPSQIFGRINAPGQVTLINPAGVYFSPGAVLDVGALTATTMNQTDADFMAGIHRFSRDGSTGAVVNQGTLRAAPGGYIALLAPEVRNEGLIVARQGTVALAAGEAITLNFDPASGLAGLTVSPSQIATLVANRTAIQANDGLVILSSTALGQLVGSLLNSGAVSVSSMTAKGGRIVLEGDHIALQAGTLLDARGATGGGTVLVGGDWQGSGKLHQATTVGMDADARIDASATQGGDGGKVVLWSDVHNAASTTRAHGSILAQGGPLGGNGGQIETSGHWLDVNGLTVNASAPLGVGGEWLLDPYNITIASGGASGTPYNPNYTAGADSVILASSIKTSLDGGTSVTLATAAGGAATGGDINVNASINKTAGGNATLTLRAHNNIYMATGVGITSTSGSLGVVLNSDYDGSGLGMIFMDVGASIRSHGGNVTLGGGTAGDGSGYARGSSFISTYGVRLNGASVDAGGGNIQMRGEGWLKPDAAPGGPVGVGLQFGSSISTTGTGTITLQGIGGAGNGITNEGIYIANTTLSTAAGALTLLGTGGNSTGDNNPGVYLDGGTQINTTAGSIFITGTGNGTGATTFENYGVRVSGGAVVSAGGSGNLTVTGNSGTGSTTGFDGVLIEGTGTTLRTNAGNLTVTGISNASGGSISRGVHIEDATVLETTGGGNISLTGTGATGTSNNDGIYIGSGAQIRATAGGNITLAGHNTGGTDANGLYLSGSTVSTSAGTVSLQGTSLGASSSTSLAAVNLENGAVVSANGAVDITGDANGVAGLYGVRLGPSAAVSSNNNAITITTDSYEGSGSESVSAGSNTVTLQNRTAGTRIDLGGADVRTGSPLTLGLSSAELNRLTAGTVVIGRNDGSAAGDVTVSSAVNPAGTGNLTLLTGGNMAIDANLGVANTLTLTAGNGRTVSGSGNLSANNLLLNGAGASYVLNTATANAVSTLSATGIAALSFTNGGALTVGTVNGVNGIDASGAVSVATASGDLTLAQNVATTDASAAALLLNAGQSAAAGNAAGGNLVFTGSGGVSVGAGGRATLMSGSVAGSTGLTALVGAGSGRFRYNSDESATNYSTALGVGNYAVYRERPVITITANNDSKTYDKIAYSGGNGVTYTGTLLNGDNLSGSLVYGGSAQGATHAGSYAIAASGQGSGQGYVVNYVDGALTIHRAALTISTSDTTKVYDGTTAAPGVATVTGGTLFGGDTLSGGTYTYTDKNAGSNKTVDVSGVTLNDGNGGGNYTVSYQSNTSSSITPKVLTATATASDKIYDGTTNATATLVISGLVGTETLGSANTSSFNSKDVATANQVTVNGVSLIDGSNGGLASNYSLAPGQTATAHIGTAALTVIANNDAKFVTFADAAGYSGLQYIGLAPGETSAVLTGTPTITRSNSSQNAAGIYSGVLVPSGVSGANYAVRYVAGDYTIVPANQLLVRTAPVSNTYGTPTTYTITSAQYLASDLTTLVDLTGRVSANGNTASVSDGVGGSSNFTLVPANGRYSSSGFLQAGGYQVTGSNATGSSGNFSNTLTVVGAHTVGQKAISVDASNVSKVYDGNTSMTGIGLVVAGLVGNDAVAASGTGAFSDRNAGNNLQYAVGNIGLSGSDAANYYLVGGTSFTGNNGQIVPKTLTATATAADKVYDGTTAATATLVLSGLVGTETLVSTNSSSFNSKDVATANRVTVNSVTLQDGGNGGLASNYVLAPGQTAPARITARPLTVDFAGVDKVYDGTTNATVTTRDNRIANDQLNLGSTARFVDGHPGNGKPVNVFDLMLTGADASNYVLVSTTGATTANIFPLPALPGAGPFDNLLVAPTPAPALLTRDGVQTRVAQSDIAGGRYADALRQPYLPTGDDGLVVTQLRDVDANTIGLVRVDVGSKLLERGSFAFTLPTQAVQALRSVAPSTATLPDGAPLPDWLRYDAKALNFRAEGAQPSALPLQAMVRAGGLRVLVDIDEMK